MCLEMASVVVDPQYIPHASARSELGTPPPDISCRPTVLAEVVTSGRDLVRPASTAPSSDGVSDALSDCALEVRAPVLSADEPAALSPRPPSSSHGSRADDVIIVNDDLLEEAPEQTPDNSPPVIKAVCVQAAAAVEEVRGLPRKKGGAVLFNASHSDYEVVLAAAEARGWRVVKSEEKAVQCSVHWIDDSAIGDWLRRVEPWMRINHFPGMNESLARKTRLARNMSRMQRMYPKEFAFLPPTWVLPDDLGDLERRIGKNEESQFIYIVKPDHLCQGRGIFLTTDLDRIRKSSAECREKAQAAVVQRYITRPMLIDGFKFDLRLYFLVAGKPTAGGGLDLRLFLFNDGLVRLCTTQYEPPTQETMNKRCMHLTNYAINKLSDNFEAAEDDSGSSGSKRSLKWFMNYVAAEYGEKERHKLWIKLMGLCTKLLLTVQPTLEAEYLAAFPRDLAAGQMGCRCFEILGIDVMLDVRRKPYLIEVNHLPSFTADSPLDEDIKTRLVNQAMDLTCANLSAKDKKVYEQLVRERREGIVPGAAVATAVSGAAAEVFNQLAGGSSASGAANSATANAEVGSSLLDQATYKDFERAYPPPEAATKLIAQCETILNKVREIFKPVHATVRRRSDSKEQAEPPQAQRAPLPPKLPVGSAPKEPGAARSTGLGNDALRGPSPARKRSQSAPGPPRCALPPIARLNPVSPRRRRGQSPTPGDSASDASASTSASSRHRARTSSRPPRVFLPLKSAQILL